MGIQRRGGEPAPGAAPAGAPKPEPLALVNADDPEPQALRGPDGKVRRLPPWLTPGNPGNSGGKKGRSGRPPKRWKEFCSEVVEDEHVQAQLYQQVLDGDTATQKMIAEHAVGRPAQVVTLSGEVDLLVNNVYGPGIPKPEITRGQIRQIEAKVGRVSDEVVEAVVESYEEEILDPHDPRYRDGE